LGLLLNKPREAAGERLVVLDLQLHVRVDGHVYMILDHLHDGHEQIRFGRSHVLALQDDGFYEHLEVLVVDAPAEVHQVIPFAGIERGPFLPLFN